MYSNCDERVILNDVHNPELSYAFDVFSEAQLPWNKSYKTLKKTKSIENDYDSDNEIVRRAKTKVNRELRLGILNYLEKAPQPTLR